ncbi:lipid A biosynthesis (KDO)2-(lauroyl)-lipid IVA acyltransferase, partial [Vibrio campbellii CAIM 519 = NBRC 15631 = ATCC 25920]
MTNQRDDFDPKAYNPKFERHFLAPKYWGTWVGVALSLPLALLPLGMQKWLAKNIAKKLA